MKFRQMERMKTIDKFRFAMAQALDDVDSIECTDEERIEGLDAMQDMLIENYVDHDERLDQCEVIQLKDYRGK